MGACRKTSLRHDFRSPEPGEWLVGTFNVISGSETLGCGQPSCGKQRWAMVAMVFHRERSMPPSHAVGRAGTISVSGYQWGPKAGPFCGVRANRAVRYFGTRWSIIQAEARYLARNDEASPLWSEWTLPPCRDRGWRLWRAACSQGVGASAG